jgi:hypothetical protein
MLAVRDRAAVLPDEAPELELGSRLAAVLARDRDALLGDVLHPAFIHTGQGADRRLAGGVRALASREADGAADQIEVAHEAGRADLPEEADIVAGRGVGGEGVADGQAADGVAEALDRAGERR